MINDSTICAVATGTGGAISIIRVSGKDCLEIVSKIFFPSDKNRDILNGKGFSIAFGEIRDNGKLIDEALVSVFIAPNSYTGENAVEISCHASPYIVKKILEALIAKGASHAMPGEFTQRAFLNGKIDLSQAEAVADVIASASEMSHKVAINQMKGGFSAEIQKLRSELLNFISLIELELDFSEEDVEFADRDELMNTVIRVKETADKLSESFSLGNAVRNGVPVVIAGKPNSGK
jgi:tRNA modification GTPase